jgi:quinol monooxygenase YgiN
MIILHVYLHVKPELVNEFREANIRNAACSVREPGILRFDVLQQEDDPSRFLLVEIYKNEKAMLAHKETSHYAEWVKTAEPMLSQPRTRTVYKNMFPEDSKW